MASISDSDERGGRATHGCHAPIWRRERTAERGADLRRGMKTLAAARLVAGCGSTTRGAHLTRERAIMHRFFRKRRALLRGQRSFILIGLGTTPARARSRGARCFWFGCLLIALILGTEGTAAAELLLCRVVDHRRPVIPAAAEAFARKTGVKLGRSPSRAPVRVSSWSCAAYPRWPVCPEAYRGRKQQRLLSDLGYDAVAVYVHGSNRVSSLSKAALKGI